MSRTLQGNVHHIRDQTSTTYLVKASKFNRGISFTYDQDSATKECFCHQFPDSFDNSAVELMTCTFEEPSHLVPVRKCSIDKGDGQKWNDCAEVFDKDSESGEEKIEAEGKIRLRLRRPSYITGLKITSGQGHTRHKALKKLKLRYQQSLTETKYINREDKVKVFASYDWTELLYALDGNDINVMEGNLGYRHITVTFNPIMTDEIIFYISGSCMINEVELYDDCELSFFYQSTFKKQILPKIHPMIFLQRDCTWRTNLVDN